MMPHWHTDTHTHTLTHTHKSPQWLLACFSCFFLNVELSCVNQYDQEEIIDSITLSNARAKTHTPSHTPNTHTHKGRHWYTHTHTHTHRRGVFSLILYFGWVMFEHLITGKFSHRNANTHTHTDTHTHWHTHARASSAYTQTFSLSLFNNSY